MNRSTTSALVVALVTLLGAGAWQAHAQSTPTAALLARDGWEALRNGRVQEAADAFRKAITDDPRDANLRLGAGLAAHLLNQPDEARHALEAALRIDPRLTPAAQLLGELAYRDGDLPRAIRTYEDALALAPQHDHMRETLARWRREAALHGRFDQQISHHFTIRFEGQGGGATHSSATSRARRGGRRPRSTEPFAFRSATRSRVPRSSSAC